jgi:hypothetical protein
MRGLAIMQTNRFGLSPHDVAREVLVADLRWRNPAWHSELHRRARDHYQRRIHQLSDREQQRAIFDYIFLHRMSPVIAPLMRWNDDQYLVGPAHPHEMDELLVLWSGTKARHHAPRSALVQGSARRCFRGSG